jgi:hypothetical protein
MTIRPGLWAVPVLARARLPRYDAAMRRVLAPFALLACLAACATPQQACIAEATRDLRTLDRLIAETEANIARGFAIDTYQTTESRFVLCPGPRRVITQPNGTQIVVDDGPSYCWRDVTVTAERPRAIDVAAERRILASTRAERARKARAAERAVAECRVRFPEG